MYLQAYVFFCVYVLYVSVCDAHSLLGLNAKQTGLHNSADRNKRNSDERTLPSNFFHSFVLSGVSVVSKNVAAFTRFKRSTEDEKPVAKSMDIVGRITSRFAETEVTTVMENAATKDLEAEFELQIPETAFISSFVMTIDGKEYIANVKEKREAQEEYEEAKEKNKTAGQISSRPRDPRTAERGMEIFAVSVNVAARSIVRFQLTYQQVLERVNNVYRYILSIRPRQVIDKLTTNIHLYEPQGLSFLEWKLPGEEKWNLLDNADRQTPMQTHSIKYSPDVVDQTAMNPKNGIEGDLIIEYDVIHDNEIGLFQAEDGYFTHYFSPTELKPLGKNIVFVIDISGSMSGRKIEQVREAMISILNQLHEDDYFKIILFHTTLEYWPRDETEMRMVSPGNIEEARDFVDEKLVSGGGTNLNGGLVKGCEVLRELARDNGNMVVFLTDGQATSGETDPKNIQVNVRDEALDHISVHSLGFGYDLDYDLLKKLSWMTDGYVQRIYEAQDAAKQLEDFYQRIGTPVLFDVAIEYDSNAIDTNSISQNKFPQFYQGSEVVVVGKLKDALPEEFDISIEALADSPISFAQTLKTSTIIINPDGLSQDAADAIPHGFLEKFYVYMRIKELYRRFQIELDDDTRRNYYDEALTLALDYKLVTPLTSMIIVQEDPPPPGHFEDASAGAASAKGVQASAPIDLSNTNVRMRMDSAAASYSAGAQCIRLQSASLLYILATLTVMIKAYL